MLAAVEDVEHRDRQGPSRRRRRGSGTAAGRTTAAAAWAQASETPRIAFAPSVPLFGVPSRSTQQRVDAGLVGRVEAEQRRARSCRSTLRDRGQDALAAVAALVAVAQLDRLVGAGRGARRHRRAADRAVGRGRRRPRPSGCRASRGSRARRRASMSVFMPCPGLRGFALAGRRRRSSRTATPGSSRPSRNSSEAPPPVEMWVIRSARPCCSTAATESPPPTTTVAPASARSASIARDRPSCRGRTTGSRRRRAGRSRTRSSRPARAPRPSGPGWPCRGRRCATRPGSSRPGASCTRCRG